jgi:hypothetical protein
VGTGRKQIKPAGGVVARTFGMYQAGPNGRIDIAEQFDVDIQKMIFSVSQYGNYSITEIRAMDVRQFYGLVAMLEEKSKAERDAAGK